MTPQTDTLPMDVQNAAALAMLATHCALCGPMYGGPGIVRYEDPQMNEDLSR